MTTSPDLSSYSEELLPQLLLERARRSPESPLRFTLAHRRFNGRAMEIAPALHQIYEDQHPFVVIQKPSQVGGTEFSVNFALWAAAQKLGDRGHVLYLMPTTEQAVRLSERRLQQAFDESLPLQALVGDMSGPQRLQARSIGPGIIYFSGADQVRQYSGIDADLVILDEFDLMKEDVLPNSLGRLRSSRAALIRVISTPTLPEFGVDGLYRQSNEMHYEVCCPACLAWLEPVFPKNVDFERNAVVCGCGGVLTHELPGRWVPQYPERERINGYQLNRLTLPSPPLDSMRLAASGTIGMKVEEFWRLDLGLAYVSSDSRLTPYDLDKCRTDPPALGLLYGRRVPVVMGVDVAQTHFWVVIREFVNKRSFPLFVGRIEGSWEDLFELAKRHDVKWCVVDAQPDTRGAKSFVEAMTANQGAVAFMCYYDRKQAHEYDWSSWTFHAARTLALDETFDAFRRERHLLPMDAHQLADGAYYEHMQALVRTTEPDEFGNPIPTYRRNRPDDLAHAETYLTLLATAFGKANGWWEG